MGYSGARGAIGARVMTKEEAIEKLVSYGLMFWINERHSDLRRLRFESDSEEVKAFYEKGTDELSAVKKAIQGVV